MKITDVRFIQVAGVMEHEGEFWEERLSRPIDLYPEHRVEGPHYTRKVADDQFEIRAVFLELLTDAGVTGLAGPITEGIAYLIARQLKSLLIDQDPLAIERLWDRMYRASVHGRKGETMMGISAVDCALWDLKGKQFGAPVYRLLGGPVRREIPAYASALGYSLEPEKVRQRVAEIVAQGYRATKWFFRHGLGSGREGMEENEALVRLLRESAGDDIEIMLDAWMSWDASYAIEMGNRIAQYRPRWLEEPVMPDRIDSCAAVRRALPFPISTGEHEYTRWGLKTLMDAGAADVLQPDIYWAGGISEVAKICTIASTYDVQVVPHGHSTPATLHLLAAQPENVCPLLEYLIKWNQIHQFFLAHPITPENGVVKLLDRPGIGMELDEDKMDERKELNFD